MTHRPKGSHVDIRKCEQKVPIDVGLSTTNVHFFDECYGENIPMVWGERQQTVWHYKSYPFSSMLDKLKKLTKRSKSYLNRMFEEDHHWGQDQNLVSTLFSQQKIYIQA